MIWCQCVSPDTRQRHREFSGERLALFAFCAPKDKTLWEGKCGPRHVPIDRNESEAMSQSQPDCCSRGKRVSIETSRHTDGAGWYLLVFSSRHALLPYDIHTVSPQLPKIGPSVNKGT